MTNSSLYDTQWFNFCDFWCGTNTNSPEVWNESLVLKELKKTLRDTYRNWGRQFIQPYGETRDARGRRDQYRKKIWGNQGETMASQCLHYGSAGGCHPHAHRNLRSSEPSSGMFSDTPSSQRTLSIQQCSQHCWVFHNSCAGLHQETICISLH